MAAKKNRRKAKAARATPRTRARGVAKAAAARSPRSHAGHDHEHHGHDHDHGDHDHDGHDHDRDHGDHDRDGHDHDHGHHTEAGEYRPSGSPLERGAGVGKLLFLDAPSGIAGDMTVAALVDLGVPFAEVVAAIDSLGLRGFSIEIKNGAAGAIGGSYFDVQVRPGQPERSYAQIDALIAGSRLTPRCKALSRAIFRRLAEAEAEVHRVDVRDVHFHEVGAIDAIVDIVAAAACFDFIGADVMASPLPLGRGTVECRHGIIPLPAPASVLCLRGVPTYDAGIEAELVTPTGAAIVATVATDFTGWPSFCPDRVGWGVGTRVLEDRPNALRAVLGEPWEDARGRATAATHMLVETNVDDLTGELAGHAIAALLSAGALDAWLTPIQMKKGRPGLTLSALCPVGAADRLGALMLRETTSIGYRKLAVSRGERPRRQLDVETPYGTIPVKVATGPWGSPQIKPEFDVCVASAEAHDVPVREVVQVALECARKQLLGTDMDPGAGASPALPG